MNTPSEEPTLNALLNRLAELEQAHILLQEEVTSVRAARASAEGQTPAQPSPRSHRSSRRKVLAKGLGVAVATVGAGAMLELSAGTALAEKKSGVFVSDVAGTPAVSATGTNGADGVDASSDSGIGVSAKSSSGTGLVATSSSGLAGHFVGNVTMDNNLTVTSALSTGTLSSGAGALASSVSGTPAVKASGTNGADGVDASSDSGTAVVGTGNLVSGNDNGGTGVSGTGGSVLGTGTGGTGVIGIGGGSDNVLGPGGTGVIGSGGGGLTGGTGLIGNGGFTDLGTTGGTGVSGIGGLAGAIGGIGVSGTGGTGDNGGTGVLGTGSNASVAGGNGGNGVHGIAGAGKSPGAAGLAGLFDGNVQVNGNFSATGTKAFVQAHPTDPSREIVYVALEGGEAGTYVRGTAQLQSGKAVIALPEHFGLVTAPEGLTIQFAPRSEWLQLYVVELDTAQLVVREAQGKSGAFDYFICGVRRGYEQHQVFRTRR